MNGTSFTPALAFFSALNAAPWRPLHRIFRSAEAWRNPTRVTTHRPAVICAQVAALSREPGLSAARAHILHEAAANPAAGRIPTIVLGGWVPDAPEQVFLIRPFLLRAGDVFYVNYPRNTFCLDLLCAQLTDLVAELAAAGPPPVILAVSFGAGLVFEWLRRARAANSAPTLAGLVLISPVTCVADLIARGVPRPATLLGRVLQPLLDPNRPVADAAVERARGVFLRMFEAGAQNKAALLTLMSPAEAERLQRLVTATIRGISVAGAHQRVQALAAMASPVDYFCPRCLPLTATPALVLFSENEEAVLAPNAPVRFALERATQAYLPHGTVLRVAAPPGGTTVQHASLIFHAHEFLPPLQAFYQGVRRHRGLLPFAA